ncbi:MAG: hypothetical protein ABW185_04625 [Sedimenticola sp.]
MNSLTPLKSVVLGNDDYCNDGDQTTVKRVYDSVNDNFTASQTYVKQYNMDCNSHESDSQESFRCESGVPAVKSEFEDYADLNDTLAGLFADDDVDVHCGGRVVKLVTLMRTSTRDRFTNHILSAYGSCDLSLDTLRSQLFDSVKDKEDFPYGLRVELKRRVSRNGGDSIATKLARDIHCLVSVIDGADFSQLTDLMSLPRLNKSTKSQSGSQPPPSQYLVQDGGQSECNADINLLREEMSQLRADVILLKQKQSMNEIRQEQLKLVSKNVSAVGQDIKTMRQTVLSQLKDIKLATNRLESESGLGITKMKSEIRVFSDKLKSCEDSIYSFQSSIDKLSTNKKKLNLHIHHRCHINMLMYMII